MISIKQVVPGFASRNAFGFQLWKKSGAAKIKAFLKFYKLFEK
jgi:hypothetical protein